MKTMEEAPKPSEENVKKATAQMIEESREAGKDIGIEWREGDWVYSVWAGGIDPDARKEPLPVTENIEGKMAGFRSVCSPEDLQAMERISKGIAEPGDGDPRETDEQMVVRIVGRSAPYYQVVELAKLLALAEKLGSETEDQLRKQVADLQSSVELWEERHAELMREVCDLRVLRRGDAHAMPKEESETSPA